jgi:hypothetical protein
MLAGAGQAAPVDLTSDLPGPASWADNPYLLLSRVQLRAGNVPTATLMEWMNCDPRWDKSFGAVLSSVTLTSESTGPRASVVSLALAGKEGSLQANFQMTIRQDTAGNHVVLELLDQKAPSLFARLRLSAPAGELLAHINPVFATVDAAEDVIEIGANDLAVDLLHPEGASGLLRVRLPGMTLLPAGLLASVVNTVNPPLGGSPVAVTVNPLTLHLAGGRTECSNLVLTLTQSRQRLTFAGSVGFDGSVEMVLSATVSRAFGSDAMQLPISGTIGSPVVKIGP